MCGKKKQMGNIRRLLRGHYNVTGRRSFDPNLQRTKVGVKHVLACVNCIRTLHKNAKVTKTV